jgi:hypothetical protein
LRAENAELKNILEEYKKTGSSVPGASEAQVRFFFLQNACFRKSSMHALGVSLRKILISFSPGKVF